MSEEFKDSRRVDYGRDILKDWGEVFENGEGQTSSNPTAGEIEKAQILAVIVKRNELDRTFKKEYALLTAKDKAELAYLEVVAEAERALQEEVDHKAEGLQGLKDTLHGETKKLHDESKADPTKKAANLEHEGKLKAAYEEKKASFEKEAQAKIDEATAKLEAAKSEGESKKAAVSNVAFTEEESKERKEKAATLKRDYKEERLELKDKITLLRQCANVKARPELLDSDILLSVRNLKQFFFFGPKIANQKLKAVSNISFDVHKGECFGIVGESGCGKTTTGRTIIRLYNPTSGSIYYRGYRIGAGNRWNKKEIKWNRIRYRQLVKKLAAQEKEEIAALDASAPDYQEKVNEIKSIHLKTKTEAKERLDKIVSTQRKKIKLINHDQRHVPSKLMSEIQMIFQDPVDSLDPRMTVEDIIQEGLHIQGHHNKAKNHEKVVEVLEKVGLVAEHASRYPHEFSGGQRQRIGIARALIMNPKLLICDEPISALDVSIRAQIINLLNDLKDEMGLTMIFIAHDLSVVKYFCDRIAVMYFGKMVELASSDELFRHPLHPYTTSLLSAIPKPNPLTEKERVRILYKPNEVHDYSVDKPVMREVCPGHLVYCNNKEFEEYQARIVELDKKAAEEEGE